MQSSLQSPGRQEYLFRLSPLREVLYITEEIDVVSSSYANVCPVSAADAMMRAEVAAVNLRLSDPSVSLDCIAVDAAASVLPELFVPPPEEE